MTSPTVHTAVGAATGGLVTVAILASLGLKPRQAPQSPPPVAPGTGPASGNAQLVDLLRSIDGKLDSKLVETPTTAGEALHRIGFVLESSSKTLDRDLDRIGRELQALQHEVAGVRHDLDGILGALRR